MSSSTSSPFDDLACFLAPLLLSLLGTWDPNFQQVGGAAPNFFTGRQGPFPRPGSIFWNVSISVRVVLICHFSSVCVDFICH
ncbi:hypothetical protein DFH09DRAFT_1172352 [Mycena vulgaris]|nr:hypothetical protein DFH09DRAFT_1172352 [Mycena vulgaris]